MRRSRLATCAAAARARRRSADTGARTALRHGRNQLRKYSQTLIRGLPGPRTNRLSLSPGRRSLEQQDVDQRLLPRRAHTLLVAHRERERRLRVLLRPDYDRGHVPRTPVLELATAGATRMDPPSGS